MSSIEKSIGVFDSGMGGLTVLRALKSALPHESFIYLGDTARLPYGTKSQETVIQYAEKMTQILIQKNIKMLVVACNTATAAALDHLQNHTPNLPIVGVIEPGAQAAVQASNQHQYALLATETTIASDVYQKTLRALDPKAEILTQACGLFVALAEENCINDAIAAATVKKYLSPLMPQLHKDACIILGCTHFPVLTEAIKQYGGVDINIVDSATATAQKCAEKLKQLNLQCSPQHDSTIQFLVTDNPKRFQRIGPIFLGHAIAKVTLINLKEACPID